MATTAANPENQKEAKNRGFHDKQWSGPRLVEAMADLATGVTGPRAIEDVFSEVCAAAVESIPGADLADIMLLRDGQVLSLGATSELSITLDRLQQQFGEGPCAQAARDT